MGEDSRAGAGPAGWITWSRIQQVLSYVGIAGAGGSGFALLCFGIGFLAVRHHDEMLGLPSRATAYGAMVRTGAMFFPNSLYYLLVGAWKGLAAAAGLVLLASVLQDPIARLAQRHAPKTPTALSRFSRGTSFLVIHSFLLFFALVLFEDRAAMLHPANRHLLLDRSAEPAIPPAEGTPVGAPPRAPIAEGRGPTDFTAVRAARYFVMDRLKGKTAWVNRELLQDEEAAADPNDEQEVARKHYGLSLALLALLVVLLAVERAWWHGPPPLQRIESIVRPVLYVLAVTLVVTLPAAYGVLWMPRGATWVEITAPPEPPTAGYLLTDISGDEPDVWTLTLSDTTFTLRVFKRESISEIRIQSAPSTSNLLAEVRASIGGGSREGAAGEDVAAAR